MCSLFNFKILIRQYYNNYKNDNNIDAENKHKNDQFKSINTNKILKNIRYKYLT